MKALLDTNVLLDVLLKRQPFFADAERVWRACDEGRLDGYVSAVTPTTIYYVARKIMGSQKAHEAVELCLQAFQVAPVYRETLQAALAMPGEDFEDNVQIACCQTSLLDLIVTRDRRGFAKTQLPVLSTSELLIRLG